MARELKALSATRSHDERRKAAILDARDYEPQATVAVDHRRVHSQDDYFEAMKAYRSMKDEPNFMAMPGTYMGSHYRPEVGGNPNGLEAVTVGRVRGRDNAVVSERHML